MSFVKILAIPAFIVALILLISNWWVEGKFTEALLDAFDIGPFIGGLIFIAGFIGVIVAIIILIGKTF